MLLSGGADSVCLLDVAVRLGAQVSALHVNYGLRAESDADEQPSAARSASGWACRWRVERVYARRRGQPSGRRRATCATRSPSVTPTGGPYARGHTASDQAETVLYRLAVSPGRRALLGMAARRGRLVRPLLDVTREETRAYCRARGLEWVEDLSNADPAFRARARAQRGAARAAGAEPGRRAHDRRDEPPARATRPRCLSGRWTRCWPAWGTRLSRSAELHALPRGLARLVLRRLAERAAGGRYALSRADCDAILALGERGSSALDLGGGLRAVSSTARSASRARPTLRPPQPVSLPVPGRCQLRGLGACEAVLGLGR